MKIVHLILAVIVFTTASCFTKKGDPGPAGTAGTSGTTGANGLSVFEKQGSMAGKLSYIDYKDSALNVPFNYEYTKSLTESQYWLFNTGNQSYQISVVRTDIADTTRKFSLQLYGDISNGSFQAPSGGFFDFAYATTINNNLFELSNSGPVYFSQQSPSTCVISNFVLDTLSGRVTFQYVITCSSQDINPNDRSDNSTPAIITGSVDAVLNRNRYLPSVPLN